MSSPVDVCNRSLQQIGAQAFISSISPSDGSTEANVCSVLYTPKIQALHRSAHWNFARKQLALTQLKAQIVNGVVSATPPPFPWLYSYAYPAGSYQRPAGDPVHHWNVLHLAIPIL